MSLEQGYDQRIRDFIQEINEEFVNQYGSNYRNSRFRRQVKRKWLLEGMKRSIYEEFNENVEDSWPDIVQAAQDAEWLADLRYKEDNLVGEDPYYNNYDDDDFCVEDGWLVVYTDGACFRNGKPDAQAGIGVWFGDYSDMNVSEPLDSWEPATNNVAEIKAVMKAVEIAKENDFERIEIRTDSQYLISSMTDWIFKWLRNGWVKADGTPLKHKHYYRCLLAELEGIDIKWVHVRGHSDDEGNIMADKLARAGAARY